ncbi:PREDICTED: uncharacterized protein LOC106741748 [Dinoponera quadriceps]|uniref:Uncharacterized protein LOC106741748 n=1 Tax=Dinoponera quadriceps TaxID=609295 RepID=A0A6P3WTR4_DINQU|nr:PREDICTED: uncharacterized protein LOC106741748 [Dinoponera quadriceps]
MKVDHTTILRHLSEIGKVKKMDKTATKETASITAMIFMFDFCFDLKRRVHDQRMTEYSEDTVSSFYSLRHDDDDEYLLFHELRRYSRQLYRYAFRDMFYYIILTRQIVVGNNTYTSYASKPV